MPYFRQEVGHKDSRYSRQCLVKARTLPRNAYRGIQNGRFENLITFPLILNWNYELGRPQQPSSSVEFLQRSNKSEQGGRMVAPAFDAD